MDVGAGGAEPAAAVDVAIELAEAFLAVAVDVVGQRVAGLASAREERAEQRVRRRAALEDERAVVTAPRVVRCSRKRRLHLLEVRQAVSEVPGLHPRIRRPALEVERVAALEDLAVDARRATEHLPAGVEDPAAVHERLRFRFVHPVVEPAADRERQRRRHVDERVESPIKTAGLEDEHARVRILGQAVGEHGPGRATTDDDEVELPGRHRRDASASATVVSSGDEQGGPGDADDRCP